MNSLRDRYNRLQAEAKYHKDNLNTVRESISKIEKDVEKYTKSRWALIEAARLTRENFKHEVDDLANLVIKSVFTDRDFEFGLVFYEARGQTECRPVIYENNNEFNPKSELGGSTLDVLGIFFRPILWSLDNDRTREIFILDEPGRYLDKRIDTVGETIAMISHSLGVQFIITTHNPKLAKYGDKSFHVTYDGKASHVSEIGSTDLEAIMPEDIEINNTPRRVRRSGN